jgi:hypothetical protein
VTTPYELIAKWESRSGKHFAELYRDGAGYAYYRGNGCGGNLGNLSEADAITLMQSKVDSGYFLPDDAKTPMKRTV